MSDTFRGLPSYYFYHAVPLPDGSCTPGRLDPWAAAPRYGLDTLPLKGKSILDVAAWSGGWSFYAESRGATEVIALDRVACRPQSGLTQAFDLIRTERRSSVLYKEGNVYDLWRLFPDKQFDVVFCFGLLYHLTDPLYALRNCIHAARSTICLETLVKEDEAPYLELIPPGLYHNDTTNVYCPTTGWIKTVMQQFGWSCVFTGKSCDAIIDGNRGRQAMIFNLTGADTGWSWTAMPHPQAY